MKQVPRVCAVNARVVANTMLCRDHVAIEVVLPDFPPSTPGQFLQLLCADEVAEAHRTWEWGDEVGLPSGPGVRSVDDQTGATGSPGLIVTDPAFLRRPFSIADRWDLGKETHLVVISRTVGVGTRWLEHLNGGDNLNLSGPLGHGFDIPINPTPLVLVGGGVGIPPLLYLTRALHAAGVTDVTCIFGSMTRDLFPVSRTSEPARDATPRVCLRLPSDAPFPAVVTTDDGTLGFRGFTTAALRLWAERRMAATSRSGRPLVLACGPDGMLRAVAHETRALQLDCQLCIEKPMGCGLGTCLSCVARVVDPSRPDGWRWALACTEGPVFARDQLSDYAD